MEVAMALADGTVVTGGSELMPDGFSNATDCHGSTFAGGQVWINNNQAGMLLNHSLFTPTNATLPGDVGIYYSNSEIVHSVTWMGDGLVYSKAGITEGKVLPAGPGPGTGWSDGAANLAWYARGGPWRF